MECKNDGIMIFIFVKGIQCDILIKGWKDKIYFVDRKLIEERLVFIEEMSRLLEEVYEENNKYALYAGERACHMLIESMMDVGNQMIDGFIMRDPGSFEDIAAILVDEKVIPAEEGGEIEALLPWRKELLQNYTSYSYEAMLEGFRANSRAYKKFPERVRHYLTNELGPVSAFLPEEEDRS